MIISLGSNEHIDLSIIKDKQSFISAVKFRIASFKNRDVNLSSEEFISLVKIAKFLEVIIPIGKINGSKPAYEAFLYEILKLNSVK
jgi:hypothetical protein